MANKKTYIKMFISPGAIIQGMSYCPGDFFDNTVVCILMVK